jgi:large subunit ribosomal protein L18
VSKQIHAHTDKKYIDRARKKRRIRGKIFGTAQRPRLTIFKSGKHFYAQVIDDLVSSTLVCASTMDKEFKKKKIVSKEVPSAVANLLAQRAKDKKINQVIFDRNGFLYHGKIKIFADILRTKGLKF